MKKQASFNKARTSVCQLDVCSAWMLQHNPVVPRPQKSSLETQRSTVFEEPIWSIETKRN